MAATRDDQPTSTPPPQTRASPPAWRTPLLIIHVAASAGLIGAALVLVGLGVAGLGGADPRTL